MSEAVTTSAAPRVGAFHPSSRLYRYTVLVLAGLLTIGSYFAYDSIGALGPTLIEAWKVDRQAIGLMYSVYSIAPILFVFAAGILSDRIGTRAASLLFSALIVIGAVIVAIAPNLWVALVGRFIFGAGSESLIVVQSAIMARWFTGRELALAFGVTLTISRLGTQLSFTTEQLVASRFGWKAALWGAAAFCGVSLVANLLYWVMDRHGERVLKLAEAGAGDRIVLGDVLKFKSSYWLVVALCVTFYSAIFPFTALAPDLFHDKWGMPLTADEGGSFLVAVMRDFLNMGRTAGGTSAIIIFASMVFAPFAGSLIDRIGKRASLMTFGALLMIPCYLVLAFTHVQPAIPMVLLGAAFVLVPAAMWPSVPLLVDKEITGSAFGLMTMIQNVGLFLFPFANGSLRDHFDSYTPSMLMFAGLGTLGLVFAVMLKRADVKHGSVLDNTRTKAAA